MLAADYVGCMRRLMRYPPVEDVYCIVEKAIQIRRYISGESTGFTTEGPNAAQGAPAPRLATAATAAERAGHPASSPSRAREPTAPDSAARKGRLHQHGPGLGVASLLPFFKSKADKPRAVRARTGGRAAEGASAAVRCSR